VTAVRTQVLLWAAQRVSAAALALFVLVHLVTIIYAVRNGLTGAEILARTNGNWGWGAFYALFVLAVAVHAPIGLRAVISETFAWRGRSLDGFLIACSIVLLLWGWRAVYAVVVPA
jgi:fumarate reductase subunit C